MEISFFKEEYNPDVYCGVDSTDIKNELVKTLNHEKQTKFCSEA
ncbi:MAG: hypothetical protein ACI4J7_09440 [Ruminiclostridium sp.]